MTRRVVRAAPAKLNLFLEVLARRPDGYHELDSVFAAIDLHDTVELTPADEISIEVLGGNAPVDDSNLAWRAASEFFGSSGGGVHIRLTKRIPSGAGLGGGSSDAAAVLLGLHELFDRPLQSESTLAESTPAESTLAESTLAESLLESARKLGADVPFFLTGGLAHCGGIGDLVLPISAAPAAQFLLVSPEIACETPRIYAAHAGAGLIENPHSASVFLEEYLAKASSGNGVPYFNRLQEAAERVDPRLRAVREEAEARFGLRFTMTGSGSSYFAAVASDFGNPPEPFIVDDVEVTARIVRSQ